LSPSTEDYDRGEKLEAYRMLESVREIVLVAHEGQRVDVWRREGDGWQHATHGAGEVATLVSIGARLTVDEV
jgi:Uma2 family endonuclease